MKTQLTIGGAIVLLGVLATAIGNYEKVTSFVDPMVESEAEANAAHEKMQLAENDTQQTQAGYNAYMMRQILLQEIETLKLKIKAETDPDKKAELQAELESKQEFVRKLKQEERRQMMKGTDNG